MTPQALGCALSRTRTALIAERAAPAGSTMICELDQPSTHISLVSLDRVVRLRGFLDKAPLHQLRWHSMRHSGIAQVIDGCCIICRT
eukprot:8353740-Alexandrium_andersonii.AAC.1